MPQHTITVLIWLLPNSIESWLRFPWGKSIVRPCTEDGHEQGVLMSLQAYCESANLASEPGDLLTLFQNEMKRRGLDYLSYHIVRDRTRSLPLENGFVFHTFPKAWVDHYTARNYFAIDPIMHFAIHASAPYNWNDVGEILPLEPEQIAYMEDLAANGPAIGWAVPVFGPSGSFIYFGIGSDNINLSLSPAQLTEIQLICQLTHKRYQELAGWPLRPTITLSPREIQVLQRIAQGMEKTAIASHLDISEHTVDTLVRRVFAKMDVSDRVNAALKGVGMGIIEY
jgi:DNA-binding CsgD family transcriptional regulator